MTLIIMGGGSLDDLDFLLTEECLTFMEAAPAPVKESFSNTIVATESLQRYKKRSITPL